MGALNPSVKPLLVTSHSACNQRKIELSSSLHPILTLPSICLRVRIDQQLPTYSMVLKAGFIPLDLYLTSPPQGSVDTKF